MKSPQQRAEMDDKAGLQRKRALFCKQESF